MSRYGKFLPIIFSAFPLVFLLGEIWSHPECTSAWLSMRILAGKLLLSGKELYVDFWDWSQPAAIALISVSLRLREGLESILSLVTSADGGIAPTLKFFFLPEVFVPLAFFLVAIISFALTARLFCYSNEATKPHRSPLLLAFSLSLLITRFDFGDLQCLLLFGILPWIVLRVNTAQGMSCPRILSVLTGIFAGIAACVEAWYVLFFLALELALFVLERRKKYVFSIETGTFLVTCLAYLGFLLQLPAVQYEVFWRATMPLRFMQCTVPNTEIYGPNSSPHRLDVFCGAALAMVLPFLFKSKDTLLILLANLCIFGVFDYIWQNDGLSHGLILSIFSTTALVLMYGFKAFDQLQAKTATFAWPANSHILLLAVISVLGGLLFSRALQADRQALALISVAGKEKDLSTVEDSVERYSKRGQKVAVVSDFPQPSYPLLLTYDRQPAFYTLNFSAYRLLATAKLSAADTYLSGFNKRICADAAAALSSGEVPLVLVAKNFEPYLQTAPDVKEALAQNYQGKDNSVYLSADNRQPHEFVGLNWEFATYQNGKLK